MKFRKKPVVIEAIKWDGTIQTLRLLQSMGMKTASYLLDSSRVDGICELRIETLESPHEASLGDWIIKGVKGEFYPCKPDIFEQTYELVGSPT